LKTTNRNSRDDLPDSIPARQVPIGQHNPAELDALAEKVHPVLEVPKDKYPPGIAKRMQNLAPYKGRTKEGMRRWLENLQRRQKMSLVDKDAPLIPAHIPQPTIPVATSAVPAIDAVKAKYIKAVLSKEEYDLFLVTWAKWFVGHADFTMPEDLHDVQTLCMEEVIQFRINLLKQRYPNRDYSQEYNQSYRRGQQARENLLARRADRMAPAGNGKGSTHIGTLNVAVLAGAVDDKKLMELQQKAQRQLLEDMDLVGQDHQEVPGEATVIESDAVPE
jgi:hypothetical protein